MWKIVLTKPDGKEETFNFLDGDTLVVEFPLAGVLRAHRHAVCNYKLRQAENRAEYFKAKLGAPTFAEVDLSAISTDALMREIGSRAEMFSE